MPPMFTSNPTVPATPSRGVASSMPDLPAFKVVQPRDSLKVEEFRLPDGSPLVGPDGYLVPPAREFSMVVNAATRMYSYRFDEAMRDNWVQARAMRRDAFVRGLLEERILPTINRRWQLDVDNDRESNQKSVRDGLTKIVEALPDFDVFKRALLDGVWYGRAGCQWNYFRNPEVNDLWSVRKWDPVHGDSIQFTYDGVPAILMDAMTAGWYAANGATQGQWGDLRSTDRGGQALVLQRPTWRNRFAIHQHIREKADYFEGELAGSVQGLGLRGLVYWHYQIRTEALTWMLAYMQSVGQMDMLIFNYPWGNDAAKQQQQANANKIIGKAAFIVPRNPQGNWQAVEQLSMNDAGLKALHDLISEYFDRHIERLIVGQSMSSGADNDSGLGGSGRAAFAQATKDEILVYDSNRLDEVLTRDLIKPLKGYNFKWARFPVRFKSVLPNLEAEKKVASGKTMVELKVPIKMDELREAAGFSRPEEGDEIVQPPPDPNAGPMGMGGMPGAPTDPNAPPAPPQPGQGPPMIGPGGKTEVAPPPTAGQPQPASPPPSQPSSGGGFGPSFNQAQQYDAAPAPAASPAPYFPGGSNTYLPKFDKTEIGFTRLSRGQDPTQYVTDATGHEHKGSGPGGGQFTGSGGQSGGSSSQSQPKTKDEWFAEVKRIDREHAQKVYDEVQKRLDAGETVMFNTMIRAMPISPKNRAALRIKNGDVQVASGKNWNSLKGQGLQTLAHNVGLPGRPEYPESPEEPEEVEAVPHETTRAKYLEQSNDPELAGEHHARQVAEAVKAGIEVSPEVLADYPELSAAKSSPTAKLVKEDLRDVLGFLSQHLDSIEGVSITGSWASPSADRQPDRKGAGTSDVDLVIHPKNVDGGKKAAYDLRDYVYTNLTSRDPNNSAIKRLPNGREIDIQVGDIEKSFSDKYKTVLGSSVVDGSQDVQDQYKTLLTPTQYGDQKLGCVMVPLQGQAAIELLSRADLVRDCDLADDGREDEPHVTVRYGFEPGVTTDEVELALRGKGPFELTLGGISCFYGADSGKDYDVVKVDVTSPQLRAMNSILGGLPCADTFKDYKPHATIAYVKKGLGDTYKRLLAPLDLTVVVDELVYSDSEKAKAYFKLRGLRTLPASVQYTKDAAGHEHKGKGEGGGQFTSGGDSDMSSEEQLGEKSSEKYVPIKVKTNKKTPEPIQKIVADIVAKVEEMGLPFKGTVEIDNSYAGRAGRYFIDDDVISLNGPMAESYSDPRNKDAAVPGWSSVSRHDHPESTLVHEIGHSLHAGALTEEFDRKKAQNLFQAWIKKVRPNDVYPTVDGLKVTSAGFKKFAKEVGGYAATNPLELVAEVFTGRKYGKKYSKEVDRLYEAFGGP